VSPGPCGAFLTLGQRGQGALLVEVRSSEGLGVIAEHVASDICSVRIR
jgi:hypothetical protein